MKNFLLIISLFFLFNFQLFGQGKQYKHLSKDELGMVSYCLPSTSLILEVEVLKEEFYAGPFARFAYKYLGIQVGGTDTVDYTICSMKLHPFIEADHTKRFTVTSQANNETFLSLCSQGLISTGLGKYSKELWRFSTNDKEGKNNFTYLSSPAIVEENAAGFSSSGKSTLYDYIAVQQNMVNQKTLQARAAETANAIFELRKKRLDIMTGNTDANFSGEALQGAVQELMRLEKEYMTLFTGYSVKEKQRGVFEIVPDKNKEEQSYLAFRLSGTDGLLNRSFSSGGGITKIFRLEIVPGNIFDNNFKEEKSSKKHKATDKQQCIFYRIPMICSVRVFSGKKVYLEGRLPIYQFGIESSFPLEKVQKK